MPTQEQAMALSEAKLRLLYAAMLLAQRRLFTMEPNLDREENDLFFAARRFSAVCEGIDPRLWGPLVNVVEANPESLDKPAV